MSLIATAASTLAASPALTAFTHGHKKAHQAASSAQVGASSSTQGEGTTQSLLTRVFESRLKVAGVGGYGTHSGDSLGAHVDAKA